MSMSQSALAIRAARRNAWIAQGTSRHAEAQAYVDYLTKVYVDHCARCKVPVALPPEEDELTLMRWLKRSGADYKPPPKY